MKWYFHKDIEGTHLLFESFQLADGWNLFAAYIFIVLMCWTERGLTYYLDQYAYTSQRIDWKQVVVRTVLYGFATVLRLWYMLTTMYFNTGLFIVVVVALTCGQFVIEVLKSSKTSRHTEYRHAQYKNLDKRGASFDEDGHGQDTAFVLDDTNFSHDQQQPPPSSLDINRPALFHPN
ncbi:unnamed protein product [Absidia cylindrospora]